MGSTGTVSAGALSDITVTTDMAGAFTTQGQETMDGVDIEGAMTGTMTAIEDPAVNGVPADNGSG